MLRITLSGNPEGGWIGEVHDGDRLWAYNPEGEDLKLALRNMLNQHFAPTEDEAPHHT